MFILEHYMLIGCCMFWESLICWSVLSHGSLNFNHSDICAPIGLLINILLLNALNSKNIIFKIFHKCLLTVCGISLPFLIRVLIQILNLYGTGKNYREMSQLSLVIEK